MSGESADDRICFIVEGDRLLGDDVPTRLLERGWAVTDLDVPDDEPLEYHWPPTAPVGYGGRPEWLHPAAKARPHMFAPRSTPWTAPTRITRAGDGWRLDYGEATAQRPDRPRDYGSDAALVADLERIECWPLSVEETKRIRAERIVAVTTAWARDDHYRAMDVTEPYGSRLDAIRAHMDHESSRLHGLGPVEEPATPRPRGDLRANYLLVDAEAWAAAVRTARAGGEGWGVQGLEVAADKRWVAGNE